MKTTKGKIDTPTLEEDNTTDNKETATQAPKEEEEDEKLVVPNAENQPAAPEKTPSERFDAMTDAEKQRVINLTVDKVYKTLGKDLKFVYHNYEEDFKPEGYVIPDVEKMDTGNQSYQTTDTAYWYPKSPFRTIEYQPKCIREKYQISLWKVDSFGVVKIKDSYITPSHERVNDPNFSGFRLHMSSDRQCI